MNHVEVCWFCDLEWPECSVRRSTLSRWVNPSSPLFGVWLDFHAPCQKRMQGHHRSFLFCKRCQVQQGSLVPFSWKPIFCRNPPWFLMIFGVQLHLYRHSGHSGHPSPGEHPLVIQPILSGVAGQLLSQLQPTALGAAGRLFGNPKTAVTWRGDFVVATWVLEINQQTYFNLYT